MRKLPLAQVNVWIGRSALESCSSEATAHFPLETGGTFMGFWADPENVVVNGLIGCGPAAQRSSSHFLPDQEWQVRQIAKYYADAGRRETYVGDWHSHPRARSAKISRTDRRVLKGIIDAPAARCPTPLMLIFFGDPTSWRAGAWLARRERRGRWFSRMITDAATLRVHDN